MRVYDRNFDWRRITDGPRLDDADEQREKHYEQRDRPAPANIPK
jgi:hypothetical protein